MSDPTNKGGDHQGNHILNHAPAANTQATASAAAGGANVYYVMRRFLARLRGNTTAPATVKTTVQIRDGATGAGTILAEFPIAIPAAIAAADDVGLADLNIEGSRNTAMTIEFAAVGGANTFESVYAEIDRYVLPA